LVGNGGQELEEVGEVGGVGGADVLVGHVVAVTAEAWGSVAAGDGVEVGAAVGAVETHLQVAAGRHGGGVEVVGVYTGDDLWGTRGLWNQTEDTLRTGWGQRQS